MKKLKSAVLLVLFLVIAFLPVLGITEAGEWYEQLNKPLWTPPSAVFAPIWMALYVMIGLAGFFAWARGGREDRFAASGVWIFQLALNALWSPLFFSLRQTDWALGLLIFLWFAVLLCIGIFSQRSSLAAWLMVPYFLWVSFACSLNAAIVVIN